MLKSVFKSILNKVGLAFSIIVPFKLVNFLIWCFRFIYSGYLKRVFKSVGNNLIIHYPINLVGAEFITIGSDFSCFARLRLEACSRHLNNKYSPVIVIGNGVSINYDCHIACVNKVIIGNNVLIASKVFITDHFHGETTNDDLQLPPSFRKVISRGSVVIEDNVLIGEGVVILPNLTIGKNSIVGANSVVTKSFPMNSVIAGNPAVLIRTIK